MGKGNSLESNLNQQKSTLFNLNNGNKLIRKLL